MKATASCGGVSLVGDVLDSAIITNVWVPEAAEKLRSAYQPPELPKPEELPDRGALPPGSRLPFTQNAVFTGRKEDLLNLAGYLLFSDIKRDGLTQNVAVATGLGGIGKSQLAVEFCYRFGRFFHGVHWIQVPASQKRDEIDQSIAAEIAACGLAMHLPRWPDKLPDQVALTLGVWAEGGHRLIVLDNIEDPEVVLNLLPQLSLVHLLLTSRRSNWPAHLGLKTRPLDVLTPSESIELLRKLAQRLRERPDKELEDIAERLGNLPLALDLAGRYMEECYDLSPLGYLKELDEASSALEHTSLEDCFNDSPTKHANSLATTFALSWNRLTEEETDTLSRQIFKACGYCSPNVPIPKQLLAEMSGTSDRSIYRALSRLSNLGLIVRSEKGPKLHPLLAEFARRQDHDIEECVLPNLAKALKKLASEDYSPHRMDILYEHLWPVARFSENVEPKIAGGLWIELGDYLSFVAEYLDAKFAFEEALRIYENVYGLDHPCAAETMQDLGMILQKLGDLQGAKMNFERALKIDEKVYGPDHSSVARDLNNIGMNMHELGDLQGAKMNFERALAINEEVYGPDHSSVARDLNNIGMILQELEDLQGAKMNLERALAIDEKVYGSDHPGVAIAYNNIATNLQKLGDLQGAKMNFERALAINEEVYGPDHPSVAIAYNNIATNLQKLGDLQGAKMNLERALVIDEKVYGSDHPHVAKTCNNIGMNMRKLGDLQGAKMNLERALKIDEKVYRSDHSSVARDLNNIGLNMYELGDLKGAKMNFERALAIFEEVYGPDHPNVAVTCTNLGVVLYNRGNRWSGKRFLARASRIYKKCLGKDHPTTKDVKQILRFASTMPKGLSLPFYETDYEI